MAKINVITITENKIREIAEGRLIKAQKCSSHKDDYYSHIVYGMDSNIPDYNRTWLVEQMRSTDSTSDFEQIRINANKLVLYVNPAELKDMMQAVRRELTQIPA